MTDNDRELARLKNEVAHLNGVLHRKNVALDAMNWVWCDGGCHGGVNRYTPGELTEEMVIAAERNTKRLRAWYNNKVFKDQWKTMTQAEREAWLKERFKGVDTWDLFE